MRARRAQPELVRCCPTLFLLGLMLALVSCGAAASTCPLLGSIIENIYVTVSFAPDVPFQHAMRILTDVGLQPEIPCGVDRAWQPQGQQATYTRLHKVLAQPRWDGVNDWQTRVRSQPGVVGVGPTNDLGYFANNSSGTLGRCGSIDASVPPPLGTPTTLTAGQAGAVARVTFKSPLDTYEAAVAAMVNLGLELDDYCAEQAETHAACPEMSRTFFGQEQAFLSSSSLVVETGMGIASDHWQQQLQSTPGVVGVETPYAPPCPPIATPSAS